MFALFYAKLTFLIANYVVVKKCKISSEVSIHFVKNQQNKGGVRLVSFARKTEHNGAKKWFI